MNEAQKILKKYFGYENFRPGQDTLIKHILDGEDVLGIMPTGAGKSNSRNDIKRCNNRYFSTNLTHERPSRHFK